MNSTTEATEAYHKLRRMILRTELKPGETLVESELMQQLEVGRSPLRDALHLLAHDGLIEIVPRRGTSVSQVTLSDLQQIFELRSGIEQIVARLATARATGRDLQDMHALVEWARASTVVESDVDLDSEFHNLMLRIAGNKYLSDTYRRLADASLRLLYLTGCGMEPRSEQIETLEDAEQALLDRDPGKLAAVLTAHIQAFRDRVRGSIFTDYPVDMAGV